MKKMLLGLGLIGVIGLTACSGDNGVAEAKGESNIKLCEETLIEGEVNYFRSFELVDEETGVHYLAIKYGEGIAVTPMYDQSGALKVSK